MSGRPFTLEVLTRRACLSQPRKSHVLGACVCLLRLRCTRLAILPLRLPREALNTGACPLHYGMSHVRLPARIFKAALAMAYQAASPQM